MAHGVQPRVLGFANQRAFGVEHDLPVLVLRPSAHARGNLSRLEAPVVEIAMALDTANPVGEDETRSPLGHASFHFFSSLTIAGASGTVRCPAVDFGAPVVLQTFAQA